MCRPYLSFYVASLCDQVTSSELTANKLVNDNNRLRERLLGFTAPKEEEEQWQQEKLVELEFLVGQYKSRCTALTEALQADDDYQRIKLQPTM